MKYNVYAKPYREKVFCARRQKEINGHLERARGKDDVAEGGGVKLMATHVVGWEFEKLQHWVQFSNGVLWASAQEHIREDAHALVAHKFDALGTAPASVKRAAVKPLLSFNLRLQFNPRKPLDPRGRSRPQRRLQRACPRGPSAQPQTQRRPPNRQARAMSASDERERRTRAMNALVKLN